MHRWSWSGRPDKANVGVSFLFQTLLLLGGDIELNPSHRGNSCTICLEPVKRGDKSIQCSECNGLSHLGCYLNMDESQKVLIQSPYAWIYPECNKSYHCWGHLTVGDIYRCKNKYVPLSSIESTQNIGENMSTSTKTKKSKNLNNVKEGRSQPKRSKLTCLVINCRSLKNKAADLEAIMSEHQPAIVIGNESWLNSNISNNEIFPENYNVFRKDRHDGYGGIFQAVKKDLIVTQRSDFDAECEILWTHCKLVSTKAKSFLFGASYRPNSSDLKSLIERDKSLFSLGDKIQRQNVIVTGDFNALNINWETLELTSNTPTSEKLLEIIEKHDLCQMVMEPTRQYN